MHFEWFLNAVHIQYSLITIIIFLKSVTSNYFFFLKKIETKNQLGCQVCQVRKSLRELS